MLVVNDNWQRVPTAKVCYGADRKWWDRNHDRVPGHMVRYSAEQCPSEYGVTQVEGEHRAGLCTDPWKVYYGENSGHQAINIAYHLGATDVALLGYDMQYTGGIAHWFGDHQGLNNPSENHLARWAIMMETMAKDCIREGMRVTNCSRDTALTCFPRMEISKWLTLHA